MKKYKLIHKRVIGMIDSPTMEGHIGIYAQTGSGKGALGEALIQQHRDAGWKCIIWDISRLENTLMGFPCDQPELIRVLNRCGRNPSGKKSQVLFPLVKKEMIDKYTYRVPETWIPFKLPFGSIGQKEFEVLMGGVTKGGEKVMEMLFSREWDSPEALELMLNKLQRKDEYLYALDNEGNPVDIGHKTIYQTLNRALTSLMSKNILCKDDSEYALDLDALMKDNETISCFTGFSCNDEEEFMLVFINIMKKILNMRLTTKYPSMCIYIPEISNYAGSTQSNPVSKKLVRRFLKESRDAGIRMIIDSLPYEEQLVFKTKNKVCYKQIGEIVEKNISGEVLSFNKQSKRVDWRKITGYFKHKNVNNIFEIELVGKRRIKCTGSHSVFSIKDGKIVESIVKDLKKRDFIIVPKSIPISNNKNRYSDDVFWLFGFWIAEGYINKNPKSDHLNSIEFCNTDRKLIEKTQKILRESFNIKTKIRLDKRRKRKSNWNNCFRLIFCNKNLAELFRKEGLNGYSCERTVPKIVFNSSKKAIKGFLSGFWDGEGNKTEKFFHVCSTNEQLIDEIGLLLTMLGENWKKDSVIDKRGFKTVYHSYSRTRINELGDGNSRINQFERYPYELFKDFFKANDLESFVITPLTLKTIKATKFHKFMKNVNEIMKAKHKRFSFGLFLLSQAKKLFRDGLNYNEISAVLGVDRSAISRWIKGKTVPTQLRQKFDLNWEDKLNNILSFINSDIAFEEIKSIKKVNNCKYVYDVSVGGNENFLTRDLIFAHNTQRPQDVDSAVRNQATIVYVGRMQAEDVAFIDQNMMEIPRHSKVIYRIPHLEIGRFVKIWNNGREWRYPMFIAPPESHKKEANEDIFSYYERMGVKFKEIKDESSYRQKIIFSSELEDERIERGKKLAEEAGKKNLRDALFGEEK